MSTKLEVGSPVKITKRSKKYNHRIDNVGYIGYIDEITPNGDGYNIQVLHPLRSWGAVDADCVEYYYDPLIHAGHPVVTLQIKPGYWVTWYIPYESYEIVRVSSGGKEFDSIGYDCPISINDSSWEFLKPFDPEDIILNKEI